MRTGDAVLVLPDEDMTGKFRSSPDALSVPSWIPVKVPVTAGSCLRQCLSSIMLDPSSVQGEVRGWGREPASMPH